MDPKSILFRYFVEGREPVKVKPVKGNFRAKPATATLPLQWRDSHCGDVWCCVLSTRWWSITGVLVAGPSSVPSTVPGSTTIQVTCVKRGTAAERRAAAPTIMSSGVSQPTVLSSSAACDWVSVVVTGCVKPECREARRPDQTASTSYSRSDCPEHLTSRDEFSNWSNFVSSSLKCHRI